MRAFFRALLPLAFFAFVINSLASDNYDVPGGDNDPDLAWESKVNQQFDERLHWLEATPFVLGGASMYEGYGKTVVTMFHHKREHKGVIEDLFSLEGVKRFFSHFFTNLFLRGGFVLIAFWPYWLIAFGAGYYAYRNKFRGKRTDDMLGVCDRGVTPFYSGVYGPLRSNNSFSATDFSCPNLACPGMAKQEIASGHALVQTLNRFGAANRTNIDLARVVLNYADFPGIVEGEQAAEEEPEADSPEKQAAPPVAIVITNAGGTLEQLATEGLEACLSAHATLKEYAALAEQRKISHVQLNSHYETHLGLLRELSGKLSPGAKVLIAALTPHRAWALAQLPSTIIASAYLATEAGKCLVYRREGVGFSRISRYPHLQARAVIQSLVSFGREYNGDARLVMRQAIICSRRHGDFGRAFLPDRMPVESRSLRDWLEVLYTEPKRREIVAQLVELDGHMEEISVNWRSVYSRRLRQALDTRQPAERSPSADPSIARFWKGVVYKSVVLVPLSEVISMALRGVDEHRLKRIADLISLSQRYQTSISISARLPGFKREAAEVANAVQSLAGKDGKGLMDRWIIVRRMLTRYNWLSTRVGDDAVPANGVIQGIVLAPNLETQAPEVHAFDSLVPLRHRRYDEMFGKTWEATHYSDSPHPSALRIFVEQNAYEERLKIEQANAAKNVAGGARVASA